jgi:hypothetical protein
VKYEEPEKARYRSHTKKIARKHEKGVYTARVNTPPPLGLLPGNGISEGELIYICNRREQYLAPPLAIPSGRG